MNELEEIKNRIDIVEYIGRYVQLKQGGRNFKGCCPFHNEKTPSFYVTPERQIWHCFGACGEGGDIFAFAQKMDGLTFPEAVQMLAEKAGVKLEKKNFEKSDSKNRFYNANELAEDFFIDSLHGAPGKQTLEYLEKRGLTEKTIKEFKLGFAPSATNALANELKKHGFNIQELEKIGLVANKRGQMKDFFWNRLMFPIHDITGRTVAFAGRVLDNSVPKYMNTPANDVYDKSNILFNIDLAKEPIRKADYAIICEGYMDVIASYQAGVKNIVAPCGTALTERQLKLIGRFTKNLKLAFDVDFAGSEATRRAIELAWKLGFNIKVIEVPAGKDPADAVMEDVAIWKKAVGEAKYVVDYLFDAALKKYKKNDAIGKKMIGKDLLPVIKRIPDEIEKDTYIKRLAKELSVSEESVRETLRKMTLPREARTTVKKESPQSTKPKSKKAELERNLIGLLILNPLYVDFAETTLAAEDFCEEDTRQAFAKMLEFSELEEFTEGKFLNSLKKEDREVFDHYILAAESNFEGFDDEKKAEEIYFGVKRLKKLSLESKKKSLSTRIAQLDKEGNQAGIKEALEDLQVLIESEKKIS